MDDLDKSFDGLDIEEVLWTCGCGTPMELERIGYAVPMDLCCRRCGLVASITITVNPPKEAHHV